MSTESPAIFEVEDGLLESLSQDTKNANVGTDRGRDAVRNSLVENKFAGAIVVDKNGNILGGNKTQQAAIQSGFKGVKIVKTDGQQAIAIQRTDLDIDSPEGRRLAIALNRTAELGLQWDASVLSGLSDEGVDLSSYFTENELDKLCSTLMEGMEDIGDEEEPLDDDEIPSDSVKQFNLFIQESRYQEFVDAVEFLREKQSYESATDVVIDLVMAAYRAG